MKQALQVAGGEVEIAGALKFDHESVVAPSAESESIITFDSYLLSLGHPKS